MAAAGDSGGDSGPHLVAFCRRPLNHTHSTHFTLPPRHTQQVYMIMMLCVASRSFPGAVDDKLCEHVTSDMTDSEWRECREQKKSEHGEYHRHGAVARPPVCGGKHSPFLYLKRVWSVPSIYRLMSTCLRVATQRAALTQPHTSTSPAQPVEQRKERPMLC